MVSSSSAGSCGAGSSCVFVGGGVVEAAPDFRDWLLSQIRKHTTLREEQQGVVFALVPDLDMAGARGAALAAWTETSA